MNLQARIMRPEFWGQNFGARILRPEFLPFFENCYYCWLFYEIWKTKSKVSAFNTNGRFSAFSEANQKRSFKERLIANFLSDNLWFSIFVRRTLSNYNRKARITARVFRWAKPYNIFWYENWRKVNRFFLPQFRFLNKIYIFEQNLYF